MFFQYFYALACHIFKKYLSILLFFDFYIITTDLWLEKVYIERNLSATPVG